MLKSILNNRRGSMLVLAALSLSMMLAVSTVVIDVGNIYLNKTQLSNVADAAVLAAAQELPKNPDDAETVATRYSTQNGKNGDVLNTVISNNNREINVQLSRNVGLVFAQFFGMERTFNVSATATAKVSSAGSVPWSVPFVIVKPEKFDYTHQFTMRMYDPRRPYGPYEFDYMNIGIDSMDFNKYLEYLQNGYVHKLELNQTVQYFGESSGGRESVNAFYDRTRRDTNRDYKQAKVGDPRVMLVGLVDKMLPRNTRQGKNLKLVGFVGIYLEEVHRDYGTNFYAKVRFLEGLNVGTGDANANPTFDNGLNTIQLIQ